MAAAGILLTFFLNPSSAVAEAPPPPPSVRLIDTAEARGEIDRDTALLYKAYTVFAPDRVPVSYRTDTPAKSGTLILVEIDRSWGGLRPSTREKLSEFVSAPARAGEAVSQTRPAYDNELVYTTTNFIIHYTLSGTHKVSDIDVDPANGVPDYVDWVAEDAEFVWATELETMGWLEPPADIGEGGDARYDLYLWNMSYYGVTFFGSDSFVGDNPNSPMVTETRACYSYMRVENDFTAFAGEARDNLRVALAHEFNHAIHAGYDSQEAAWLMEATATWIEDEVYDEINDNVQFLDQLFVKPDVALDVADADAQAYGYGRFVFPRYIAEHHGGQATVRAIWERAVVSDSLEAVESALVSAGTSFVQLFPRFVGANYVLSPQAYNQPYTYEEAAAYRAGLAADGAELEIEARVPFSGTAVAVDSFEDGNGRLERHSAEYWVITSTMDYEIAFEGNPGVVYAVQLALRDDDHVDIRSVALTGQAGIAIVHDPAAYDEVALIVANTSSVSETTGYALTVRSTSEGPPSAVFTCDPVSGTLGTNFAFDASGSSDDRTPVENLEVRWDWDSDRIWDTEWSLTKTATHFFARPRVYSVTLEVRDEADLRTRTSVHVAVAGRSVYVPVAIRG